MNEVNRGLLDEVIQKKLELALNSVQGSEEEKAAFKQAMEAIDRDVNATKNDVAYQEHIDKIDIENSKVEIERSKVEEDINKRQMEDEFKKKEARNNLIRWGIEIGVVYFAAPMIAKGINESFAKLCMAFEKTDSFTSTPGRSLGSFFKFKK